MVLKIIIKNLQKKIPVKPRRIRKAVLRAISLEGIKIREPVNICFVDDSYIRKLNRRYLHVNAPTDVLAFDTNDIVISARTALKNARIFNTSLEYELCLYAVHGLLHIIGYNDATKSERLAMQQKERRILKYVYP